MKKKEKVIDVDPNKKEFGKKFGRSAGMIVIAVIVLVTVLSSFYTVGETESVVITTFGKAALVDEKGLHFKLPFIQRAYKVDTTVRGQEIGYDEDADGNTYSVEHESIMITSDYNFIDCDFYISYQVTDPIKYLYSSDQPDLIIRNIAMSSIRSTVSAFTVDNAITTGKAQIQSNVKAMIISELEKQDIGLTLVDASIQDVEPPTDNVIEAFTAVETAKQGKESAINEANAYRNEQLPAAEAEADKIIQTAEAAKTARINEATGQAARFNQEYNEYIHYPLITKRRMFLETMSDVLPRLQVIIEQGDGTVSKYYPITDFSNNTASKNTAQTAALLDEPDGTDSTKEN